jgi:PBP1b-binding outer membrane lipoprotein LpoB
MKNKYSLALIIAMILSSCVTTTTTITSPDGTVTVIESTTVSGEDVAIGATGTAVAIGTIQGDK